MIPGKQTKKSVFSQSLFSTVHAPTSPWRGHAPSTAIHTLVILALFLITVPVLRQQEEKHRRESVTLVAPVLPENRPRITHPLKVAVSAVQAPIPRLARINTPARILPVPPQVTAKTANTKPALIAAAPEVREVNPIIQTAPLPDFKTDVSAPKSQVRTGAFQNADAALGPRTPQVLKVGGFGDPNGVPPTNNSHNAQLAMAQVGSFDRPEGGGTAGGGGQNHSGGVRQTSFGDVGGSSSSAGAGSRNAGAVVHTGAFGGAPIANGQSSLPAPRAKPVEPPLTPVEILSKPTPIYTAEARTLKLEGQVALDVVFLSNGSLRILRIVKGLGHGLDEAAEHAALQVRFRPATRGGVPVDSNATIHITFQLT